MDPLLPDTWYNISPSEIFLAEDGRKIYAQFDGYYKTLKLVFPEIKFEPQFLGYSIENRRKFFENYAREHGFDPLVAENWYKQSREKLMSRKGARRVIHCHNNSIDQALIDLFPDIGLDTHNVWGTSVWQYQSNRRKFFKEYAKTHGFDPLIPSNWYKHKEKILSAKGVLGVLFYYKNSLAKALMKLFPNIGLAKARLRVATSISGPKRSVWESASERRKFFEIYAKNHGFDHLIPDNWYSQPKERIMATPGAFQVIHYHNDNVSIALLDLFPDIGLTKVGFLSHSPVQQLEYRKAFFERVAKENKFDPLNAKRWYSIPRAKIFNTTGSRSVLAYYSNNIAVALRDVFPSLIVDEKKLPTNSVWSEAKKRRKFFEQYAAEHGFDPLVPENWYSQTRGSVIAHQGGSRVLFYHNSSVVNALLELFPKIGLEKFKFRFRSSWHETNTRRKFFEAYAEENGFDPLQPTNWYSQRLEKILHIKGARNVVAFHNNDVTTALLDLFPNIGLEKQAFTQFTWNVEQNRKQFFVNYAKHYNFDPLDPENWYAQPRDRIMEFEGAARVMSYHNNNVSRALSDLFPNLLIDPSRFPWFKLMWSDPENRKKFFVDYAQANGFDPYDGSNWYTISIGSIMRAKGGVRVLAYHDRNLSKALLDLFPDIGLERSKFALRV
eukprot:Phypoly_transcript_03677.p1 GENE.Phypoly_transcript_03677~~Phypoly_transcript_03677.p1  ORF type:complete len:748 (+),score=79.94 Phypoly_transcript_03677:247-2244(+)